jgi:hypothetical protein
MSDAVRMRFVEALSRRAKGQPEAVQRILEAKANACRAALSPFTAGDPVPGHDHKPDLSKKAATLSPLAQLNQHIRNARPTAETHVHGELANVRRFRRAWSHKRSQDHLATAIARKPANAGPINSHVLVLEALAMMQELSPDYLRRFMGQLEAVQWLERAREKPLQKPAKAAGRARPKDKAA